MPLLTKKNKNDLVDAGWAARVTFSIYEGFKTYFELSLATMHWGPIQQPVAVTFGITEALTTYSFRGRDAGLSINKLLYGDKYTDDDGDIWFDAPEHQPTTSQKALCYFVLYGYFTSKTAVGYLRVLFLSQAAGEFVRALTHNEEITAEDVEDHAKPLMPIWLSSLYFVLLRYPFLLSTEFAETFQEVRHLILNESQDDDSNQAMLTVMDENTGLDNQDVFYEPLSEFATTIFRPVLVRPWLRRPLIETWTIFHCTEEFLDLVLMLPCKILFSLGTKYPALLATLSTIVTLGTWIPLYLIGRFYEGTTAQRTFDRMIGTTDPGLSVSLKFRNFLQKLVPFGVAIDAFEGALPPLYYFEDAPKRIGFAVLGYVLEIIQEYFSGGLAAKEDIGKLPITPERERAPLQLKFLNNYGALEEGSTPFASLRAIQVQPEAETQDNDGEAMPPLCPIPSGNSANPV